MLNQKHVLLSLNLSLYLTGGDVDSNADEDDVNKDEDDVNDNEDVDDGENIDDDGSEPQEIPQIDLNTALPTPVNSDASNGGWHSYEVSPQTAVNRSNQSKARTRMVMPCHTGMAMPCTALTVYKWQCFIPLLYRCIYGNALHHLTSDQLSQHTTSPLLIHQSRRRKNTPDTTLQLQALSKHRRHIYMRQRPEADISLLILLQKFFQPFRFSRLISYEWNCLRLMVQCALGREIGVQCGKWGEIVE
uniref:Uncharacterized protein n=1 Tax=Glossina brevipalpis TaxID=37001 RepID=A0A1A9WNF0_9MUSC